MNKQNYLFSSFGPLLFFILIWSTCPHTTTLYAASTNPGNTTNAEAQLLGFDAEMLRHAKVCAPEVTQALEKFIDSNILSINQLFDTFYIPIPNTSPQKFNTQYDHYTDKFLTTILDSYLKIDSRILYVVAADINGYVPTHNTRYSKPLTHNLELDTKNNRTKRMFNDRTGINAARNAEPFLLQSYSRDTGQLIHDISIPLMVKGKHWGALRIGYTHD